MFNQEHSRAKQVLTFRLFSIARWHVHNQHLILIGERMTSTAVPQRYGALMALVSRYQSNALVESTCSRRIT
jgi:hypothetical protein